MINLFLINEDEKNKILNLHKDATKRQYLREQTSNYGSGISVNLDNLTLTFNYNLQVWSDKHSLEIYKDTIFRRENNFILVTTQEVTYRFTKKFYIYANDTPYKGFIRYYCDNKSFAVGKNTEMFGKRIPEKIQKGFDDLCTRIKTEQFGPPQQPWSFDSNKSTQTQNQQLPSSNPKSTQAQNQQNLSRRFSKSIEVLGVKDGKMDVQSLQTILKFLS
jgi:hypothetical protein